MSLDCVIGWHRHIFKAPPRLRHRWRSRLLLPGKSSQWLIPRKIVECMLPLLISTRALKVLTVMPRAHHVHNLAAAKWITSPSPVSCKDLEETNQAS